MQACWGEYLRAHWDYWGPEVLVGSHQNLLVVDQAWEASYHLLTTQAEFRPLQEELPAWTVSAAINVPFGHMRVLTSLRRHRHRFVRLSSWSQLCYASRLGLLQAANKLLMLSLQRLDLLLEGHLDGLHHRSVLCDQRGLAQHTRHRLPR